MSAERNINDTELLTAYIDGQLTAEERSALEARLQTDAELSRQLALLHATVDLIKGLPQLTAPHDFRLTRQMVRSGAGDRRIYIFSVLSAAAAIVLLFVGFGLLTMNSSYAPPSVFSNVVGNLAADGDGEGVALLPTDMIFATQAPSTVLPRTGYFAEPEQAQSAPYVQGENAFQQAQEAQATLRLESPTGAPPPLPQGAAPADETDTELDDYTGTAIEQLGTTDERGRVTEQTEAQGGAPVSGLTLDALPQTTQEEAAVAAIAQEPSVQLSDTPLPTPLPTATALPTETPSGTPTNTPAPTPHTSAPTLTPVPIQAPSAPVFGLGTIGVILIIVALVLLAASALVLVTRRRR
jgi:hypothetical protein